MGIKDFYLPEFVRCPVCGAALSREGGSLYCGGERRHTYDIAKEGYVNLLPPGRAKNARTGDGADMIRAREKFLAGGGYDRYSREAAEFAAGFLLGDEGYRDLVLLDSGCGEGYYTETIARNNSVCGIDISKDALKVAAKRCETVSFAVASIGDIPLKNGSRDVIVNIFAPDSPVEFSRVLCDGGRLITVQPMERHLLGLKAAIYDEPYLNPAVEYERDGFELLSKEKLKYSITLDCNEDIISLFKMTPYYYKTGKTDQEKLTRLDTLTTEVEFCILEFKKL